MKKSDDILLREWWLKELGDLTEKVIREEERRQIREGEKGRRALEGYGDRRDIEDAYAYGMITERKYNLLIRAWEQTEPKESNLYQMKIELLQELYEEQKTILEREVRFEEIQAEGR